MIYDKPQREAFIYGCLSKYKMVVRCCILMNCMHHQCP